MVTSPKEPIDKHKELAALFRAGIAGDSASYNRFLQQISILLRRVIGKRLPASDIEDVVQEILISVHKARHTYDGKRPLMPWVMAIAGFRINDHLRRLYRRGQDTVDVENIAQTLANDVTESHDDSESIDELLKEVPERQRRILTMMYVEGHTAKETGRRLAMNESAVKVAAHRAIKKIRDRLGTENQ
jgi:RNA polymerase sigma-70 factor (ECF subfamily)